MQHAALPAVQCGHNRCHYNQQLHLNISTIYLNYLTHDSVSIDATLIMFGFVGTSNRSAANVSITLSRRHTEEGRKQEMSDSWWLGAAELGVDTRMGQ